MTKLFGKNLIIMKRLFNFFLYISIFFLIIYLYQDGYLYAPNIQSYAWLIFSLFFLFCGFLVNAKAWQRLLIINNIDIPYATALNSIGLSIFGKYIPGKIWVIVGRAAYVSGESNQAIFKLSSISFLGQATAIITGIVLGSIGLWYHLADWFLFAFILAILLLIVILSPVHKVIPDKRIFSKQLLGVFRLFGPHLVVVLPWFCLFWLCWGVGFYGLANSLHGVSTLCTVPSFILAASIGVVAFFVPGGIGVREGVLFFFLINSGLSTSVAVTTATSSRLWFLLGEFFIFFLAIVIKSYGRKKRNDNSMTFWY